MKSVEKKKYWNGYFLSFFLPILFLGIIMALTHVYPFGNNTVVVNDMKNQYLSLMTYFRNNITHPRNFLYSYQLGLGGNFFAAFAYYLSNPFNLLACLFPPSAIPLFFMINTLINVGWLGLTTYTLLNKSIYLNKNGSNGQYKIFWCLLLSLSFTFSAFITNYQLCVMWIDAVVLLPLVLLGLDRILYSPHKSTWLYWISLAGLFLINWYIGIIVAFFLFILMVFWTISMIIQKDFIDLLKKGIKVCLLTALSIGIGAVMLLPSYLAQRGVNQQGFKFTFNPVYQLHTLFHTLLTGNVSDLISPVIIPQEPLIFCGLFTVVLVILFFMNKQINLSEKLLSLVLLIFLGCSTYFMGFYMIWHALTMPNGFPQRESFVISLLLICIAYKAIGIFDQPKVEIKVGIACGIVLLITLMTAKAGARFSLNEMFEIIGSLLLVIISALLVNHHSSQWMGYGILGLIVLVNVGSYNYQIDKIHFSQMPSQAYSHVVSRYTRAIRQLKKQDSSFYRIGSNAELTPNDPFTYNYNGVQAYISQQPTSMTDYISALGYYQKHSWYRWNTFNNGSTAAVNDLLGIKYYLLASPQVLKDTQKVKSMPTWNRGLNTPGIKLKDEFPGIEIYQNKMAFPLVFNVSKKTLSDIYQYNPQSNPFDYFNWILASIEGKQNWIYSKQNVYSVKSESQNDISYHVRASASGNTYLYLAHPQATPLYASAPTSFIINGTNKGEYGGRNAYGENGVLYIGKFHKGEEINITLQNGKLLNQPLQLFVAIESPQRLQQLHQYAVNPNISDIKVDGDWITFKTNSKFKGGYLGLSVPFDPNWSVRIDHQKGHVVKILGDLSGIKVPQGAHQVRLKYNVNGLKIGMIISVISLIILSGYEITKRKLKQK